MLIYLIIAAEFAILYTVFWYVYVREPKPYKISNSLWGKYGQEEGTASGVDPTLEIRQEQLAHNVSLWKSQLSPDQYGDEAVYARLRTNSSQYRRSVRKRQPARHNGSFEIVESTPESEQALISRVLNMFGKTLDALNVKVP